MYGNVKRSFLKLGSNLAVLAYSLVCSEKFPTFLFASVYTAQWKHSSVEARTLLGGMSDLGACQEVYQFFSKTIECKFVSLI